MQLQLHPDRQAGIQNPLRQLSRLDLAKRRREQHRASAGQFLLAHDCHRPVKIGFAGEDEFDLVVRGDQQQVFPAILSLSPEPGVLISTMRETRGSTSVMSIAPLVSSDTE